MIIRHQVASCCGNSSFVLELPQPFKKFQTEFLKKHGFTINDMFYKSGVLYATKGGMTLTGSFGAKKLTTKGNIKMLDEVVTILEEAILLKE